MNENFKLTKLGYFPENWEVNEAINLGLDFIDSDRGANYPKEIDFSKNGYCLFLNAKNVTKQGFKFTECQFISVEKDNQLRKGKLNRNDIVITTRGSVGNIALFDENIVYENIRLNSGMVILRDSKHKFNTLFLYQFLKSSLFQHQVDIVSFGSAQPQLTITELKKLNIVAPPLIEQNEIAVLLTTVDKKIEAIKNLISETEKLKQGLMQRLLTKGIGHNQFKKSELGDIPIAWEVKEINQVTTYVDYRGKTPPKVDSGIYLVTARNIKNGKINYDLSKEFVPIDLYNEIMSRGLPLIGDVLITTEAPLGEVAAIDNENVALAQRIIKYRGIPLILDNEYLKYSFLSPNFQNELIKESTGSTVKGIKGSRLHKLKILIPSISEQKKIALLLKTIDEKLDTLVSKKECLIELKVGLMQQLLTGKIRANTYQPKSAVA